MNENTNIALRKLDYCAKKGLGKIMMPKSIRGIWDKQVAQIGMSSEEGAIVNDLSDLFAGDQLPIEEIQPLYIRTCSRMIYQEMRKEKNIEEVISIAKNVLEKEPINTISQDNVEEDWIMRFFNSIQDISDKKMQDLWGKILAGEIRNPNSFSFRSLDAVTKMSKSEAQLFMEMSKYIINFHGHLAVLNDSDLNNRYSVTYGKILALDECGIIDSNALMTLKIKINDNMVDVIVDTTQLLIAKVEEEKEIEIKLFKLTRIGQDLYRIVGGQVDENYFNEVARHLARENKEISFSMHKIINWREDGEIEYEEKGINISID